MKIGDKVVYKKQMKGLPQGSTGEISNITKNSIAVVYPQYLPVLKGGAYIYSNYVYAHSANKEDLNFIS